MEAPTYHNMALVLSRYSYSHWQNVFSGFPFTEFESVQRTKPVSPKFTFDVVYNYS